jgi:hypothetical protein
MTRALALGPTELWWRRMMPQSQAIENGTIDVENDVAALQAALVRDLGTHWGIRGNKEMQKLHWMYFSFGTV